MLSPLILLLCLASSTNIQADQQVHHWLERMNTAISELNFDGHFVYLRGDMLDAMKIRHRIELGNAREYLVSLTGTPREVIRDNSRITIIQSVDGKMSVSQRSTAGKLSPFLSLKPAELENSYHLLMGKDVRVAGRTAKVILLQPKDNFRYACHLALDQGNALPLGVTLFDETGQQVSRIMFTDLQVLYPTEDIPSEIDPGLLEDGQELAQMLESVATHSDNPVVAQQLAADPQAVGSWRFERIPAGYQLKNYHLREKTESREKMEHFVFSDGLATVSVYVEALTSTGLSGEARLGAVNALGAQINGHQLTIVGEVPLATLRMLLSGASLGAG